MTDLENREAFEKWHFLQWKLHNAVTITVDFAKVLYDRAYSHDYTSSVREVEFKAWQASAQRQGFKLAPLEPSEEIIKHMTNTPIEVNLLCDNADIFLSEDEALIAYKAMINAV